MREIGAASKITTDEIKVDNDETAASYDRVKEGAGRLRSGVVQLAGITGLAGLAFGFKDTINAALTWNTQQTSLQQALKRTGQYSAATMAQLSKAAETGSVRGGFAAPQELAAIQQFETETKSATRAQQLNTTAMNLARGAHLGYTQATKMVATAVSGTTGRIAKYLGPIQAVTKYTDDWTSAMKTAYPVQYQQALMQNKLATATEITGLIQAKYGGQMAAYSKTTSGALSNLKDTIDLIMVRMGQMFLPMLKQAALWLLGVANTVKAHWPQISAIAKSVFGTVKTIVLAIVSPFLAVAKAILGSRAALIALGVGIGTIVALSVAVKAVRMAQAGWNAVMVFSSVLLRAQTAATVAYAAVAEDASMMTKLWAAAQAALDIVMDANPIGLIVIAIGALVAGIVFVILKVKAFGAIFSAVFTGIKNTVSTVVSWIGNHWKLVLAILIGPIGLAVLFVTSHFDQIKHLVVVLVDGVKSVLSTLLGILTWPFREAYKIIMGIVHRITGLVKGIVGIPGKILGGVGHALSGLNPFHSGGLVARVKHYADGGIVGGYGNQDSQMIAATPGEYVLTKQVVQHVGVQPLNALNASGGIVGPGMSGGAGVQPIVIPVTLKVGARVMAEATAHYAYRANALA